MKCSAQSGGKLEPVWEQRGQSQGLLHQLGQPEPGRPCTDLSSSFELGWGRLKSLPGPMRETKFPIRRERHSLNPMGNPDLGGMASAFRDFFSLKCPSFSEPHFTHPGSGDDSRVCSEVSGSNYGREGPGLTRAFYPMHRCSI